MSVNPAATALTPAASLAEAPAPAPVPVAADDRGQSVSQAMSKVMEKGKPSLPPPQLLPESRIRLDPLRVSFRAAPPAAQRRGQAPGGAVKVLASSAVMGSRGAGRGSSTWEHPQDRHQRRAVGHVRRTRHRRAGRVTHQCNVMYDKYSGERRFGFVTMSTAEEVAPSYQTLMHLHQNEPSFVDSQYKVYVGNLAKKVEVLSATVSRFGNPKVKGYGFVTFSSEEEVEATVSTFNNTELEGQTIRVNRA
ncbi:hypothetical protein ZWY2020_039521 [Hordeum vulgare]|nr:hypothetical protein ZWY2020_039521 [Hordeum vulgare]